MRRLMNDTMDQATISESNDPTAINRKRPKEEEHATCPQPSKKQRLPLRHVQWAEKKAIHLQDSPQELFSEYDEKEVWYAKNEYDGFLVDRLRTVQCLRASGGNLKALDPEFYCMRGLEPFQTRLAHQELHSKRHFHQSTIIIEQVRQSLLGIRDPERFRLLVGPQSEMASQRAQEQAALDEHDVYGRVVARRPSLISSLPNKLSSSENLLSQRIRRLQDMHARRLMEIYSRPGNGRFRFPIRRDSLAGSGIDNVAMATRFPIRRDSLTPIGTTTGHP